MDEVECEECQKKMTREDKVWHRCETCLPASSSGARPGPEEERVNRLGQKQASSSTEVFPKETSTRWADIDPDDDDDNDYQRAFDHIKRTYGAEESQASEPSAHASFSRSTRARRRPSR